MVGTCSLGKTGWGRIKLNENEISGSFPGSEYSADVMKHSN
jgi:hypothetical protein